jgi:UrcA family protein
VRPGADTGKAFTLTRPAIFEAREFQRVGAGGRYTDILSSRLGRCRRVGSLSFVASKANGLPDERPSRFNEQCVQRLSNMQAERRNTAPKFPGWHQSRVLISEDGERPVMKYARTLAMCGATFLAAISVAAATSPVHAGASPTLTVTHQRSEYVTRYVSYLDLNLASATDQSILKGRVGFAVNEVCNEAVGNRDPFDFRDCTYDSWAGARPQIARAVRRARDIALTGSSPIAAVAITIGVGR